MQLPGIIYIFWGRCSALMVSAINFGSSGPGCTLAGVVVLGSQARHVTLSISLLMLGVTPQQTQHPIQGGVQILLVASCFRNQHKLWPGTPLGSYFYMFLYFRRGNIPGYAGCVLFSAHHPSHSKEPQPKPCTTARIHRYCEMGFTFFKV